MFGTAPKNFQINLAVPNNCCWTSLRRKGTKQNRDLNQHPTAQVAPSFRAQTRKSGIESGSDSSLRLPRRGYHPGSRVIRQASKPYSGLVLIFGFPHKPLLLAPRYRCFAATRATRYDTVRAAAVPVAVQRRSGSPTPFRRKESTRRGCLRHCINATFL